MHLMWMILFFGWVSTDYQLCLNPFRACLHGGGGPQIDEVTCGRSPHLSCKRDQIKMRDYMDRRVTSLTRVAQNFCGF